MSDEDHPPLGTVRQADGDDPWRVSVEVVEAAPVPLDMVPLRLGKTARFVLQPGARPVKILNSDPRRAYVTMQLGASNVSVGRTRTEAEEDTTSVRSGGGVGTLTHRWSHTGEIWARTTHASQAQTLDVLTEQWSR